MDLTDCGYEADWLIVPTKLVPALVFYSHFELCQLYEDGTEGVCEGFKDYQSRAKSYPYLPFAVDQSDACGLLEFFYPEFKKRNAGHFIVPPHYAALLLESDEKGYELKYLKGDTLFRIHNLAELDHYFEKDDQLLLERNTGNTIRLLNALLCYE